MKMAAVRLGSLAVVLLIALTSVLCQKRARPAFDDLQMLINDANYANPESSSGGGMHNYGNLVTLADTLKRLQDLDKYYSHQARPRYGRSIQQDNIQRPLSDSIQNDQPSSNLNRLFSSGL